MNDVERFKDLVMPHMIDGHYHTCAELAEATNQDLPYMLRLMFRTYVGTDLLIREKVNRINWVTRHPKGVWAYKLRKPYLPGKSAKVEIQESQVIGTQLTIFDND